MGNKLRMDLGIAWLSFLGLILLVLIMIFANTSHAKEARTVRLSEKQVGVIQTQLGRSTIVSFSSKPSKVILGSKGAFVVEYVDNDIAIAPTLSGAKSNLFVYVSGRRFAFDLVTGGGHPDQIVLVRDPLEREIKVNPQ